MADNVQYFIVEDEPPAASQAPAPPVSPPPAGDPSSTDSETGEERGRRLPSSLPFLSTRTKRRIRTGRYIHLDRAFSSDRRERSPITNIEDWLNRWEAVAAYQSEQFPSLAGKLWEHQNHVRRARHHCMLHGKVDAWIEFDAASRRNIAAGRATWGVLQEQLHAHILGDAPFRRARQQPPQTFFQTRPYHVTQYQTQYQPRQTHPQQTTQRSFGNSTAPICRLYNVGPYGCNLRACNYQHICMQCRGNHRSQACSMPGQRTGQRYGPRMRQPAQNMWL